ncbi:hypothetical protein FHS19_000517 [Paenibacillus rhizosphaerae]|uniref:Uncharacterized protein n=1 Tax=Paenibacillus rhizosphaerae TaxID=297318 RepID=A0A839TH78_9BACL|nr:hypothetical protein [Paenibacillus rhizosphaerae]MBB3125863.1 hypothetical protein [Paenibacillus rhizosphaerae]
MEAIIKAGVVKHPIPTVINITDSTMAKLNKRLMMNIRRDAITKVFVSVIERYGLKYSLPIQNTKKVTRKFKMFLIIPPTKLPFPFSMKNLVEVSSIK